MTIISSETPSFVRMWAETRDSPNAPQSTRRTRPPTCNAAAQPMRTWHLPLRQADRTHDCVSRSSFHCWLRSPLLLSCCNPFSSRQRQSGAAVFCATTWPSAVDRRVLARPRQHTTWPSPRLVNRMVTRSTMGACKRFRYFHCGLASN